MKKKYVAYTDGACLPNPGMGSWAYVVTENNKIINQNSGFVSNTTSNRMEMYAVIEVLKQFKDVTIYCDSDLTVKTVNIWMKNWEKNNWKKKNKKEVKNLDLVKQLNTYYDKKFHDLVWIKGHNGTEGNELVDQICRDELIKNMGIELYKKLSTPKIILGNYPLSTS